MRDCVCVVGLGGRSHHPADPFVRGTSLSRSLGHTAHTHTGVAEIRRTHVDGSLGSRDRHVAQEALPTAPLAALPLHPLRQVPPPRGRGLVFVTHTQIQQEQFLHGEELDDRHFPRYLSLCGVFCFVSHSRDASQ